MVRVKHRYLLVNILYPDIKSSSIRLPNHPSEDVPYSLQFRQPSSDQLNAKLLMRMVRDGVADLFGDYGSGKIAGSLQIKYFSQATSTAIIRISRDHYRLVWAALTFTTRLPKPVDRPCVFQVVRVSGTIKKAEEEAIRRARISIIRAQKAVGRHSTSFSGTPTMAQGKWEDGDDDGLDLAHGIEDLDDAGDAHEDPNDLG